MRLSWIVATGLFVLGPACKKKEAAEQSAPAGPFDPLALIPAAAGTVGGVDLAGIQSTPLWSRKREQVRAEGKEVLDVLVACGIDLPQWKRVTFGIDPDGDEGAQAFVLEVEGIGRAQTLRCGAERFGAAGASPWTLDATGRVLTIEGGSTGYVIDDDTIVIAGEDWAASVEALTRGQGSAASRGPLAPVIARSDPSQHLWFAGALPEPAKALASALGQAVDARDLAGWLSLRDGVHVLLTVGLADEAAAQQAQAALDRVVADTRASAGQLGIPRAVLDGIEVSREGTVVTVATHVSEADLAAVEAMLAQRAGGA